MAARILLMSQAVTVLRATNLELRWKSLGVDGAVSLSCCRLAFKPNVPSYDLPGVSLCLFETEMSEGRGVYGYLGSPWFGDSEGS